MVYSFLKYTSVFTEHNKRKHVQGHHIFAISFDNTHNLQTVSEFIMVSSQQKQYDVFNTLDFPLS